MRQPKRSGSHQFSGFLDKGTILRGELTFSGAVRVDGAIEGSVTTPDLLIVGAGAEVKADVSVGEVEIYGTLIGNVKSSVRVTVHNGGHLKGDVATPRLVVEDGAGFDGSSETVPETGKAGVETKTAEPKDAGSGKTVEAGDVHVAREPGERPQGGRPGRPGRPRDGAAARSQDPSSTPVEVADFIRGDEGSITPPESLSESPALWQSITRSMHKRWATVARRNVSTQDKGN